MVAWLDRMWSKQAGAIGLDLGRASWKAVQVQAGEQGETIHAAAAGSMPEGFWQQPGAPLRFFRQTVKPALEAGGFRGKSALLALPSAATHVTRLRVGMDLANDPEGLAEEMAAGLAEWLPFPVQRAIVRHMDGGMVYDRHEPKRELIVFAVRRDLVEGLLDAASGVVEIRSIVPEPTALLAALGSARWSDGRRLVVEMGHGSARAYIVQDGALCFARQVRLSDLAVELTMCLRYFEHTFPQGRVTGVELVGGSAGLAQELEAALGLAVRPVAPAAEMGVATDATAPTRTTVAAHSGRLSVALGLGMVGTTARRVVAVE